MKNIIKKYETIRTFEFDNPENIEKSMNSNVNQLYEIVENNTRMIDKEIDKK